MEEKRKYLVTKKILFQDNPRMHTYIIAIAKFYELGYELLMHTIYLQDLALGDCFMFKILKILLSEKTFGSKQIPILKVRRNRNF